MATTPRGFSHCEPSKALAPPRQPPKRRDIADTAELQRWEGRTVLDKDGEKIGKVDQVFINDETGNPEWLGVTTGLFGKRQSYVPLAESRLVGEDVQVAYDKAHVKDSPNFDDERQLEPQEEADLYAHYGLQYMPLEVQAPVGEPAPAPTAWPAT